MSRHSHLLSHALTRLAVVPSAVKVARLTPLNLIELNRILSCDFLDKPATGFVAMLVCDIHEELDLLIHNDFDNLRGGCTPNGLQLQALRGDLRRHVLALLLGQYWSHPSYTFKIFSIMLI